MEVGAYLSEFSPPAHGELPRMPFGRLERKDGLQGSKRTFGLVRNQPTVSV